MATKFIQSTHKTTGEQTHLHDSDFPQDLFKEMQKLEGESFNPNNWNINLLNYKGDLIQENWDWRNAVITVRLGDLYGK